MGLHYGKDNAMIIPKVGFGDQFVPIFTIIVQRMLGQSKVRMVTNGNAVVVVIDSAGENCQWQSLKMISNIRGKV